MAASPETVFADLMRRSLAFLMVCIEKDALRLRPDQPRVRGPITPLAEKIFRILLFTFLNLITRLCNPSIATIARTVGCAESSVKLLLPGLCRSEYLTWKNGKRKRILTRAGWRVVRSSNRYRMTCPHAHLEELRRKLIKASGGRHGPLIQAVVAHFTPPSEEAKATEEIVNALAADLRPSPPRTAAPTMASDPPSQAPPVPSEGVEIGGVRVEDPTLGSVLSGLWAALEKRERRKS